MYGTTHTCVWLFCGHTYNIHTYILERTFMQTYIHTCTYIYIYATMTRHIYERGISKVTWLIHVWHVSTRLTTRLICVTWLIHMCGTNQSWAWHVGGHTSRLIHMCDMTSHPTGTWLIHMWDMTHSYVFHDCLFIY